VPRSTVATRRSWFTPWPHRLRLRPPPLPAFSIFHPARKSAATSTNIPLSPSTRLLISCLSFTDLFAAENSLKLRSSLLAVFAGGNWGSTAAISEALRGEVFLSSFPLPRAFHIYEHEESRGHVMYIHSDIHSDRTADCEMIQLLRAASNITGLPIAGVVALINSDLETDYLLLYINALMAGLMN